MKINFIIITLFFISSCDTINSVNSGNDEHPLVQSTKFDQVRVINLNITQKTRENLNQLTLLLTDYRIARRGAEDVLSLYFTFDNTNKYFLFAADVKYDQQDLRAQYTYIPLSSVKLKNIDVSKFQDYDYVLLIESDYKNPTFISRDIGPSRKMEFTTNNLNLHFKSYEEALKVKQLLEEVIDAIN